MYITLLTIIILPGTLAKQTVPGTSFRQKSLPLLGDRNFTRPLATLIFASEVAQKSMTLPLMICISGSPNSVS